MTERGRGEGLYRILLKAYPKRFRQRYEAELLEAFRLQRAEPEYLGRGGRVRFWYDIVRDWAGALVEARRGAEPRRAPSGADHGGRGGGGFVVQAFRQDVGFAVRSLLRAPAFTAIAVLTLAIGIGSNAAMFAAIDSVLLEPLPYEEPDGVVTIWSSWVGFPKTWVSRAEYRAYLTQTRAFEDLAIWGETNVSFTDPESPERVGAVAASENLVDVLGVEMRLGRFFTREEAIRSDSLPSDVIVISHEAWTRRWARDPGVVGTSTEVNGRLREIIGVLPAGFRLPTQFGRVDGADVYFPSFALRTTPTEYPEGGGSHGEHVVGRLRDGISVEAARHEVERAVEWARVQFGAYPPERRFRPIVLSAADDVFGTIRPALMALLATVVFVLLIGCANVANLMLARGDDRISELAVRSALGASRGRLVSQLLIESLVLAVLGAAAGLLLATVGIEAFKALNPGNLPRIDQVALDLGVLVAIGFVTLGTVFLFGVLPAWRATASGLASKMGGRGERGVGRAGWQRTLVATETALAVALVIGAGLMAKTFRELTVIEPGFDGDRTLTLAVSLPTTRYTSPDASTQFYRETLRRIEELPGVRSAGAVRSLPLGSAIGDWGLDVEGYDESVNPRAVGDWQIAAPGYFETMGIPLTAGRSLEWSDDAEAAPVAIVNEEFVRRYWPTREPLGRTFVMGGQSPPITVVGVAGDVRHNGLVDEVKAKFYIPVGQWAVATGGNPTSMRLVVAAESDPAALVAPVRQVIRGLDPSLAVAEIRTVDDVLEAAVAQPRFLVVLMGIFSGIALVLAVIGVYGVISYGVGRRTQEIGVRMALGAVQNQVVGLMIRKGVEMIVVGLAAGLVLAFLLTRYLESQLYGVSPTDPLTFLSVIGGFALVALGATYVPSRKAAQVDPIRALNTD